MSAFTYVSLEANLMSWSLITLGNGLLSLGLQEIKLVSQRVKVKILGLRLLSLQVV